ncbi:hypothetical protein OUZ56_033841 [Daphnia magna]|uniref:Reelin n=1 Tax=Daphnia magna TaxID=35525 RepID=A0ABR0BB57_9CRUS|nr:hypothetical protein OUZ56_033841 [Daphnia magna]
MIGVGKIMLEDESTICEDMLNALDVSGLQAKAAAFNDYNFEAPNRSPLAIDNQRTAILELLKKENVIIVKGFNGCGKTTQVPQFVLDECYRTKTPCNIVVTQPRRIAAISIAKRVCYERNWALGTVVGYRVGMEHQSLLTKYTRGMKILTSFSWSSASSSVIRGRQLNPVIGNFPFTSKRPFRNGPIIEVEHGEPHDIRVYYSEHLQKLEFLGGSMNYPYAMPKYESLNQTQWQFHPNGVISNNLCGVPETESSMNFVSSGNSRFAGITSRHITVKDNFAAYFKIRTSCGITPCHANNNRSQVRFQMRQGYEQPSWSLAKPNCLPSSTDSLCDPQMYHSSSALAFGNFPTWQRVIISLKSIPFANTWQFCWMTQRNGIGKGEKNTWALKDVYIGQMCPSHCHGHGDCIRGQCHCDNGYEGVSVMVSECRVRLHLESALLVPFVSQA